MEYVAQNQGATDSWNFKIHKLYQKVAINNYVGYGAPDPFNGAGVKYLILKAGENYVQLRCWRDYLEQRRKPLDELQKYELKVAKQLQKSIRQQRLLLMALTWVFPALYMTFKDDIEKFLGNIFSKLNQIPWIDKIFPFVQGISVSEL